MTRRFPIIPTLIVVAAIGLMIGLGVWQLQRAEMKNALLAHHESAAALSGQVRWPSTPEEGEQALFRRSEVDCLEVLSMRETAGRSAEGQAGWAYMARCRLAGGQEAEVALGWSRDLRPAAWTGGSVSGIVAPGGEGVRLVASPAQAGLEQLAPPDPRDLPNNHLSYAAQWFFFALTAAAVYLLALRRRKD